MLNALNGTVGLVTAYAAVQGPMLVSLIRARADWHRYALSPMIAAPLTAVAAIGATVANPFIAQLAYALHAPVQAAIGIGISAALGFSGGRVLARGAAAETVHQRGSLVSEQPPREAQRSKSAGRNNGITLAGVLVPTSDETKHFK